MSRCLVLSAVLLAAAQATPASAQVTSINVLGQLAGGNAVTVVCSVSKTGQITGTGFLSGTNPANGYVYKYAFTISKGATAQGKLILTGKLVGGPEMSLTAAVPNGTQVFTYIVNGKPISLTGQGVVTVK